MDSLKLFNIYLQKCWAVSPMTIGLLYYKHTRLKNMCVLRGYVEPNKCGRLGNQSDEANETWILRCHHECRTKFKEVVRKISHLQQPHRLRMSIWVHCFLYLYNHLQVGTVERFIGTLRTSYLTMQT